MRIHGLLPAAAIFLASAFAPFRCGAHELSLSQAIELALKRNSFIAAAHLSAEAAKHAATGAAALTNPEIVVAPSVVSDAGADSAVLLSQPLEINGSRQVRKQIASHQAAAAEHDAAVVRRDVVLRVSEAYWDTVHAQELVALSRENTAYLEMLSKAVQKQYEVGAVPGSQPMKSEVELARARQELAEAEWELSRHRATLNSLVNRPCDTEFTASDKLAYTALTIERAALLPQALSRRPEVGSAKAEVAAAQGGIAAARLLRTPDLAVQARRGALEAGSDHGVALAVSLPLFDWGSARAERRRADSEANSRLKSLQAAEKAVELDVEQAIQRVEASARILSEYEAGILEKSEQLARMAQIGYEKGATSYLEVLEAQRTLRSARSAYIDALVEHAKARARLEWATGGQTVAALPEVTR